MAIVNLQSELSAALCLYSASRSIFLHFRNRKISDFMAELKYVDLWTGYTEMHKMLGGLGLGGFSHRRC